MATYRLAIETCLLCLLPTHLFAQDVTVIDQNFTPTQLNQRVDEAREKFWTERMGVHVIEQNDYGVYRIVSNIAQIAQNHPELSSSDLSIIAHNTMDYLNGVERPIPGAQAAEDAFKSLVSEENPYIGMALPIVMDLTSAAVKQQINDLYALHPGELRDSFLADGREGLHQVWEAASKDPRIKSTVDEILVERYGIRLDDIPGMVSDPMLDHLKADQKVLQNGEPPTNETDLDNAISTDQAQEKQRVDALLDRVRSPEVKKSNQTTAKKEFDSFEASIADQRAAVYLASTAIGFVDQKLGKRVGVLGNAYLKIAESEGLYQFSQMPALSGTVNYSSIRLTADVVSACLEVASLLGESGPTPDQLILQQLSAISAQIDNFRKEVHERFDRVDKSLDRIYVDLVANFQELDRNLAIARQGIVGLQIEVLQLQDRLGELDQRFQSYAQSLSRELDANSLTYCLETQEYVSGFVLSEADRSKCAVTFAKRATGFSKDNVWVNKSSHYPTEVELDSEFKRPLEQNLNLLWGIASANYGLRPPPHATLANPLEWAVNANAYMQVVSAGRPVLSSQRATDEIIHVGEELEEFMSIMARRDKVVPNKPATSLAERLVDRMAQQRTKLEKVVSAFELSFASMYVAHYDPWGGTNQSKPSSTDDTWTFSTAANGTPLDVLASIGACKGATDLGPITTPIGIAKRVPLLYRMAQELGLGKVEICYSNAGWASQTVNGTVWSGNLTVDVNVVFERNGKSAVLADKTPTPFAKSESSLQRAGQPNTPVSEPKPSVIATLRKMSDLPFIVDCQAINIPNESLNTAIARSECTKKHQKEGGLTAAELQAQFAVKWSESKGLRETFLTNPTSLAVEADVSQGRTQTEVLVEDVLGQNRQKMREEVANSMDLESALPALPEEKLQVMTAVRQFAGLKALLDAVAALTLSDAIQEDDKIASPLSRISVTRWRNQLLETQSGHHAGVSKLKFGVQSRTLSPLEIAEDIHTLREELSKGSQIRSESSSLVAITLSRLRTIRMIQAFAGLGDEHVCFDQVSFGTPQNNGVLAEAAPTETLISSLRWRVNTGSLSKFSIAKLDLVIGTRSRIVSAIRANPGEHGTRVDTEILLPVKLNRTELQAASITVCAGGQSSLNNVVIPKLELELIDANGHATPFRTWTDITFPQAKIAGVVLQFPSVPSMPGYSTQ